MLFINYLYLMMWNVMTLVKLINLNWDTLLVLDTVLYINYIALAIDASLGPCY